ncbi:uncharacterized protein LOC113760095 [Coffea eugenioides]|uniref:uncharacterized protein LOC113760095 n=1 Tax=Coffea eugenioides TaxID=49369 RepID=UPI000F60A77E|nr:uncharacterized protein LOC113760095 [Coffea eugenioides]
MYTARFLMQPILRGSLASVKSPYSYLYHPNFPAVMRGDHGNLQKWLNAIKAKVHRTVPSPYWNLIFRKYKHNFGDYCNTGGKFTVRTIFGLSLVVGSISIWPRIAYCTDGFEFSVDDHEFDKLDSSDSDEDRRALLTILRRLMVPVFFLLTVLMNWGHPGVIAAKVTLILYTTKPSPFSVYLFVEQLRHQAIRQHPFIYKIMPCYAKKVEVEDYMFLCLARVELNDQNLTLLGILGSWWVLPPSSWQEAFSMLRNSFLIS